MINDDSLPNNKRFVRAIARLEFILGRVGGGLIALGDGLIALGDGLFRLRFFLLFLDDVETSTSFFHRQLFCIPLISSHAEALPVLHKEHRPQRRREQVCRVLSTV